MSEKWLCPLCGQETSGDVCEWCQAPRPAAEEPAAETTEESSQE